MKQLLGISLALVMLIGSIPFGFSDPLRVQIEQGIDADQIQCNNPNHVLVLRTNGNMACVTEKSAEKMNWEITPVSNNPILNQANYDDDISTEILGTPRSFSSASPNPVKYYEGSITLDKIPTLNETTSFNITIESSTFVKENIDDIMIQAQQFFESNPQDIPQYFKFQLRYPSSFNLEFSNTSDVNITKEQSGDLSYAIFDFPISFDKEYLLTPQEIIGTLQPTQEGYFYLDLEQKLDYKKTDSSGVVIDTGISSTWLVGKYLHIDLTDSFEPNYHPTITKIDSTKELTVTGDYSIIEREVISRFSDELKSKVTIINGQIPAGFDKETISQLQDLFDEVYRDHPEHNRLATFEDMPDNPDMIVKMPKTQDFIATFDYPENISNGDIFEITLNLESLDITNDYQQVEYLTFFGNGLDLVKEPTPYNDRDIENAKNGINCGTYGYVIDESKCTQGEPYTLPPKTVLVPNNLPNNHYQSITPDDNGQISYTVLVKALEKGEWMFKAIINDEIYRNKILVN